MKITLNPVQSNNLRLNQHQIKGNGTTITVFFFLVFSAARLSNVCMWAGGDSGRQVHGR